MKIEMMKKIQTYFDLEDRKHPSFLLDDFTPTNFLILSEAYARNLLGNFDKGLKVLEIGSGDSIDSITLSASSNYIWAIEISRRRLKLANDNIEAAGKRAQILPILMDAHKLGFPDNFFDLILGNSVLLFLDKDGFAKECYRVLKPGGYAIFPNESMANHPMLWVRRHLPQVKKREEISKRLSIKDINRMSRYFDFMIQRQFYLVSAFFAPIVIRFGNLKLISKLRDLLYKFDELLLKWFPRLNSYCWISVLKFCKKQ